MESNCPICGAKCTTNREACAHFIGWKIQTGNAVRYIDRNRNVIESAVGDIEQPTGATVRIFRPEKTSEKISEKA